MAIYQGCFSVPHCALKQEKGILNKKKNECKPLPVGFVFGYLLFCEHTVIARLYSLCVFAILFHQLKNHKC